MRTIPQDLTEFLSPEFDNDTPDILTMNAVEQIRRFISDDKSFFDSTFLEVVNNVIFSKSVGSNELFRDMIKQNIISFGLLCIKYEKLVQKYNLENDFDVVDEALIKTAIELSDEFLLEDKKYTSQLIYEKFKTIMNEASRKMAIETDSFLMDKYNRYLKLKECKTEDSEDLQKFLENKIETIDIVEQIENLTQFVSKKANDCNSIKEFAESFVETINGISTSLTSSNEINRDVINMSDVLTGEGLSETIVNENNKLKCGIASLDAYMSGGFDRGRIYTFGGQTGGGKSTVLLNLLYGMVKQINGIFFSEINIYNKNLENNNAMNIIKGFVNRHIETHNNEKKKLFLYYTLENTKEETAKRIMCRIGLLPNIFWMLKQRDSELAELFNKKGYNFTIDELPVKMSIQLKQRIYTFAQMMNLVFDKKQVSGIEIIWHAPYSISSYDMLLDCKRYQRKGFEIEAIFVDYPDKMRAADSTRNQGDQNWLELGKIIDNLKALSAQVNVPILTVTQLNKEGNKANAASKLGNTAGSMQKEYNADTQINMNFNTDNDETENKYFQQFTEQQKRVNQTKLAMLNQMLNSNGTFDKFNQSYQFITDNTAKSSDILQMKNSIPSIQKISCYITKNRDSIAKASFDMHIVYGMYLVTDFEEEAYISAKYAVETYMLIANYMIEQGYINAEAYRACVENEKTFIDKYNNFGGMRALEKMVSLAKRVEGSSNPQMNLKMNMTRAIESSNISKMKQPPIKVEPKMAIPKMPSKMIDNSSWTR